MLRNKKFCPLPFFGLFDLLFGQSARTKPRVNKSSSLAARENFTPVKIGWIGHSEVRFVQLGWSDPVPKKSKVSSLNDLSIISANEKLISAVCRADDSKNRLSVLCFSFNFGYSITHTWEILSRNIIWHDLGPSLLNYTEWT